MSILATTWKDPLIYFLQDLHVEDISFCLIQQAM